MLFWVVAALLTLAACLAVLMPLVRSANRAPGKSHDLEVYRDQLAELHRDTERGLIDATEAEQARVEIGRRILRLGVSAGGAADEPHRSRAPRAAAMAAVLAVPLVAWGLYAVLGSPDLPSQPLRERLAKNPADSTIEELVARAEAHLTADPKDGRGWTCLPPFISGWGARAMRSRHIAMPLRSTEPQRSVKAGSAKRSRRPPAEWC